MSFDVLRTLAKLAELRELDRGLVVFGAKDHRYALNDPMSAAW